MLKTSHKSRNRIVGGIVSLVLLIVAAWIVFNRQYLVDLYSFWQYQPSIAVENIAARADLADTGKFYFYTSQAEVEDSASFNNNCQRQEDKNAILGCYVNNRIYVYNVANKELDGIQEVTAAHEMLHAAWDRLSDSEQARLSVLLEAAYNDNVTPDLKDRMDYYSRNEQGQRTNELHSIVGTEVTRLNPELEQYYSKYFADRVKVVDLYRQYNKVFDQLRSQSDALYKKLVSLEANINKIKTSYNKAATSLNKDITAFNNKARNNGFDSVYAFNVEKGSLLARINELKTEEQQIKDQVNLYNSDYKQYQTLSIQRNELNQAIDSTITPLPSL